MIRKALVIIVILIQGLISYSQDPIYPTIDQEVSHDETRALIEALDLRKTEKAWRPKNTPSKSESDFEPDLSPNIFGSIVGNLFYYLLILVAIALVIAILIFFFHNIEDDREVVFKVIDDEEEIQIKDIKELDLNEMLRNALDIKDYRTAIRAEFLLVLQQLAIRKDIEWSQEKTNRDYSRALRSTPFFSSFATIANIYERVWYGEVAVDKDIYQASKKAFSAVDLLFKKHNALV